MKLETNLSIRNYSTLSGLCQRQVLATALGIGRRLFTA